ncbi:MAG: alpha/beta hydrolase [Nocardioides sp.]|uniref:alpha/beta fold hydrolase n=1 Tax=Nocardioides sp. TaxID=35761 RepID=UPI0039E3A7C2
MSVAGRITGIAVGAVAAAALGGAAVATATVNRRRREIEHREPEVSEDRADVAAAGTPLGSLRAPTRTIFTTDGVPLHVEVDEVDDVAEVGPARGVDGGGGTAAILGTAAEVPVTLVFAHGYALTLDCWHFQRAAYRGLVRSVYYDQRSHGRSGRSDAAHSTIDQLGEDLLSVLDAVVPDGPVVLVGHSMGGMTIIALAERHPELFAPLADGGRIVGAALISTTAGGLDVGRILLPLAPAHLGGTIATGAVRTLGRGHRAVDGVRRFGHSIATVATDAYAFGKQVPAEYVEFVDGMLSATPFQVVADFFPTFGALDKFDRIGALARVPTTIICGTADRLTSIGHARKLAASVPGSRLVECPDAGHMVIMECHAQVNAALDHLLAAVTDADPGGGDG